MLNWVKSPTKNLNTRLNKKRLSEKFNKIQSDYRRLQMGTKVKTQRRHWMGALKRKSNEDLVHLATDRRVIEAPLKTPPE